MFTYTAKQITSELMDHYTICEHSGMIVQKFGWSNGVDNLRVALHNGIDYRLDAARHQANRVGINLSKLTSAFFKTGSIKKSIATATEDHNNAMDFVATLEALKFRIYNAIDLPKEKRSRFVYYSTVSDALIEECQRYIKVSLLDMDREYTMDTPVFKWNTKTNVFYCVENDFSISEWRIGISGYENIVNSGIVNGVSVSYLVHNLKTDQTLYQVGYESKTGNFERHMHYGTDGVDIDIYHANLKDAVKLAKSGIKILTTIHAATIKAATDNINAVAA